MGFKNHLSMALLTTVATLPLYPSLAYATNDLEEVVVTATRYAKPLSEIGSSISVITAEDMEKSQIIFVQDILQTVPGLTLNQNGSFGGVSTLRIRGASTNQTVILIDGVQINDVAAPGGGFDFSSLDPNGIERIEVLRGPQSILYGSDAIGGVINIITPTGKDGLAGSLFAEAGSYKTFRAGGHIAGGNDRFNFSLSGSGITTDGISKADENDGNIEQDGYRNISLHGKLTGKLSENHSLQLISRYGSSRNEIDGTPPPTFSLTDTDDVSFNEQFLIAARGLFNYLDNRLQNTLSVEYSTLNRRGEADGAPVSFLTFEGQRFNLDYFGHYQMSDIFGLSFGLQHEQTKAETISPLTFNIDSVFSELSWQPLSGLTLTAGLRYDDHNRYGSTTTPRLTGSYYIPTSGTKIFANWGEGFKAPSVFQLTFICGFCGLTAPNGDLKAEQSEGWEVGIEQALWDSKINFGLTYFDQKFTNMIDFDFSVGFGNIANARSKGVELTLNAQLTENLAFSSNYTFTDAIDKATGDGLVRVPRHAAFGEIQWQALEPFTLALSLTYNGKETDPFAPDPEGWIRLDLKAAYDVQDGIEIYARIDNLLDKEYQQISGFGTADRSFYAGIRGEF